jgi:hypothetical protein
VKPEIESRSIVLVGSLNPAIFQPAWFAARQLIPDEEAQAAKIGLVHPDLTQFSLEWVQITVTREKFIAQSPQGNAFEPMRDLVLGTFRLLRHTPIHFLGINREAHFRMPSTDRWNQFGHELAPKPLWEKFLKNPGLRSLTMQGERPDGRPGHLHVKVEPSPRIKPGILVDINDHAEFKDAVDASDGLGRLDANWRDSLATADTIVSTLAEAMNGRS